jgi:hypothetical protein
MQTSSDIVRVKCTVGPPDICSASCYFEARARVLQRHLKTLRLELISVVTDRRKLKKKLDEKKQAEMENRLVAEPKPRDDDARAREEEEQDVVSMFERMRP